MQRETWKSLNHDVDKICHLVASAVYFIFILTRWSLTDADEELTHKRDRDLRPN